MPSWPMSHPRLTRTSSTACWPPRTTANAGDGDWLDVARYVQGKTKVAAVDRIDMAEPYRDYVVRALNADKPYDRFVTEHLAGDLLPEPKTARPTSINSAAPGFLSIRSVVCRLRRSELVADGHHRRTDLHHHPGLSRTQLWLRALSRSFFDPIPTRDDYAMAGIFGSTRIVDDMSENWRDGRYRLTQPEGTPAEITTEARLRDRILNLRSDRRIALEHDAISSSKRIQPRLVDYERALASLPEMPAVELEAEDYNGQNNVRRVEFEDGMVVETQRERLQWVGWRPQLPEAGTYTLLIRCAAPASSPPRTEDRRQVDGERPSRPARLRRLGRATLPLGQPGPLSL